LFKIYILIRCCINRTGNPVKFRNGPAAVIGDECRKNATVIFTGRRGRQDDPKVRRPA